MGIRRALAMVFLILPLFAACLGQPAADSNGCDLRQVAENFYAANDQQNSDTSLSLLTDDVSLISWATGANGYHMSASLTIGKDQVAKHLKDPGLDRLASTTGYPNFKEENEQVTGNSVHFDLMPDRNRPNGRPYNHYSVELVFTGCKIEIIKVVERVTWL